MEKELDWTEELKKKVEHLKELASRGEIYNATTCDRMGYLNLQLMAIHKAGWKLHSVIPFVLPTTLSLDHMTYFCVIAELEEK